MDFPIKTRKNKLCRKENPFLCGKYTIAKGLCVESKKQCERRTRHRRPVLDLGSISKGKNYGYFAEDLGRGCYPSKLKLDYEKINSLYDSIPESFNLLTYNIWGLSVKDKLKKLFKLRKTHLLKTLQDANPDIMCFQEMSEFSYNELSQFIKTYKFASEIPYPANKVDRNRNVEVYFLSKYTPKRIAVYGLPGVLQYENSMMVVEYPNLIIFNLYNQAGSKASIGQEKTWIHYSRCRYDILNNIYDMIKSKYSRNSIVICGDFNFHMDGKRSDWPELEMIKKFKSIGFVDTYRKLNNDPGHSEDTDENLMRFNQKLMEKHYRYDAVLYKPSLNGWKPEKSELIGKELKYLSIPDSKWFYNEISEVTKLGKNITSLKGVKTLKSGYKLPINASDHFGVLSSFSK